MKWAYFSLILIFLNGCSTYKDSINEGLSHAQQGEWEKAESSLEPALDNPQDQLLYLLEIGTLAQHQGEYERSNELLEKADLLSDTFLKESFANRSWALLSNPRQSTYRGNGLERVYISYLKSLNYLALAEQADSPSRKLQLQDAALVEARRIDVKLNEIQAQTPSYQDLDNQQDQAFYLKALNWLGGFYTGGRNTDKFLYRNDAWGRYMEGLQYEISKEYDDARISYQKAAELYQDGYAKQYDLPGLTAERAWLDVIRMMQKGGYSQDEIRRLSEAKLSPQMQKLLASYKQGDGELVVLEHQGFVPAKSEMSLLLYSDPRATSLVLEPFHNGGRREENDVFRWFSMVYADINPLNLIANYKTGGAWGSVSGLFTKRVILGRGVWRQLQAADVDKVLANQFIRITVPYYQRFSLDNSSPKLNISSTAQPQGLRMTSLADIAVQEQLAQGQRDIYESLIRELLRSWIAYKISSEIKDDTAGLLLGLVGQVTVFASSAADTRNWLTLPAQIRLTREPLAPGEYTPEYRINQTLYSHEPIQLKANEIKVWNLRNPR
ncbi:hypothetical protein OFY17_02280 [Marinomonas sp. C2222]|uniref:Tetratricopeptide repeat protein n=1 Tax=Marinomonas sargassi TaxID=2984494 RepID=A0ABT2YPA2_9GAMM|nr:hypothetical protein [Marinomonas sargassi]MCV2401702.1 hypothetical protein [Marinomonas sargassi]